MKTPHQHWVRQTLLGILFALANLAHAGVIQGTGASPSAPSTLTLRVWGGACELGVRLAPPGVAHAGHLRHQPQHRP